MKKKDSNRAAGIMPRAKPCAQALSPPGCMQAAAQAQRGQPGGCGGAAGICRIPDDLLDRILQLVDTKTLLMSVPAVCKGWRLAAAALRGVHFDLSFIPGAARRQMDAPTACLMLVALGCRFPHAAGLTLNDCCSLHDDAVVWFTSKCPHLAAVSFRHGRAPAGGPRGQLTDLAVLALATRCKPLTSIDLSGSRKLTDAAVIGLAHRCAGLTAVSLSESSLLTSGAVAVLAGKCPSLKSIELRGCTGVGDAAVVALATNCPLLEHADLQNCYKLTDRAVEALGSKSPRLKFINLSNCPNLTDGAAEALERGCPLLTGAIFHGCAKLTDRGVCALILSERCGGLNKVDFGNCDNVTVPWRVFAEGTPVVLDHTLWSALRLSQPKRTLRSVRQARSVPPR